MPTKVEGAGNSTEPLSYSLIDYNLNRGVNYYRLKQVDFDGNYSYSKIESITIPLLNSGILIYPNPFSNKILINQVIKKDELSIFNILGQDMRNYISFINNNQNTEIVTTNLPSGMYIIKTKTFANKVYKQ